MITYTCLNPVSSLGLNRFSADYAKTEELKDADIALVRSAVMHDLTFPENLIAVARAGAGVNNIPLERCADEGIVVFNTPGANANGVKELVLAGMLLSARDIAGGIRWVEENKEDENIAKSTEKAKKAFAGTEIAGKTLGVIGCGAIGVKIANAALALGMDVLGYDAYFTLNNAHLLDPKVTMVSSVNDIYQNADYITIHVPANAATKGMIDKDAIALMKENAVVLNFSRDVLVDEEAMVKALEEGNIGRYVVDFPTPKTAGKKGCIVIPHLGASTAESEDNCAVMAVDQIRDYVENGNIRNSVNYPALSMGVCTAAGRIAVLSKSSDTLVAVVTDAAASAGASITEICSKTRGEYAYTLIDLAAPADDKLQDALKAVPGVIRVRTIR